MPLSKYLSSVADKAQSAINASPLAGHLPTGHGRPSSTSPEAAGNQGATSNQQAATQGSGRSHAFGALSNQIRAFGQQYTSATPVQRIVTIEKSISLDFESTARDSKSQSKELYTWGQTEPEDLKDVTDRLAYLNFVHGSLAGSLADKLNAARGSLKALRDVETAIAPRRNIRAGIRQQLSKIEHDQQKGNDRKIAELREQLHQAELEDEAQEQEIRSLKRKGVRESEQLKWEALREYGEKLVLLCQAATPIIGALPVVPPTPEHPYTGAQATGAARASLQRALDNYKTGHINLPQDLSASDLHRSDTRSFGESHASELSRINSDVPSTSSATHVAAAPAPVPHEYKPPAQPPAFNPAEAQHGNQSPSPHSSSNSSPVNVAALNQTPATTPTSPIQNQLPNSATTTIPTPESTSQANALPAVTPTIAETGVPVPAQDGGPGPKSGSLLTIHSDSPSSANNTSAPPVGAAATGLPPSFESAEEEKRRLAAAHGQAMPTAHPPSNAMPGAGGPGLAAPSEQPKYESAEDEKKRLEREERERILHGNAGPSTDKKPDQEEAPPGYKEF